MGLPVIEFLPPGISFAGISPVLAFFAGRSPMTNFARGVIPPKVIPHEIAQPTMKTPTKKIDQWSFGQTVVSNTARIIFLQGDPCHQPGFLLHTFLGKIAEDKFVGLGLHGLLDGLQHVGFRNALGNSTRIFAGFCLLGRTRFLQGFFRFRRFRGLLVAILLHLLGFFENF